MIRTTVYFHDSDLRLARARDLNVSKICREALRSVLGKDFSREEMEKKAAILRAEASALESMATELKEEETNFQDLLNEYLACGREKLADRPNIEWLGPIRRNRYGFGRTDPKDLLALIKGALVE